MGYFLRPQAIPLSEVGLSYAALKAWHDAIKAEEAAAAEAKAKAPLGQREDPQDCRVGDWVATAVFGHLGKRERVLVPAIEPITAETLTFTDFALIKPMVFERRGEFHVRIE